MRSPHGGPRAAAALLALLVAVGGSVAACSDDGDGKDNGEMTSHVGENGLVCGLISTDLVRKVAGDAELGTRGPGVRTAEQRKAEPANCTVQNLDTHHTFLQVLIGEYPDQEKWRSKLDAEAKDDPDCTKRYTDDPGYGYGCVHDQGVYVFGASVNVLRGDRLIRVTVYHWTDATPEQRLALAEEIARDMDKNLTAYDREHS